MANDAPATNTPNGQPAPAPIVKRDPPPPPDQGNAIDVYASANNFNHAQRMATSLSQSTLVPDVYKGNVANCLLALDMASRIGASVLAVMQNLNFIHGRPCWSSAFLIGSVNTCGRFSPLRYRYTGQLGSDDWGCRAYAKEKSTGEECTGALITLGLAKAEGWLSKSGSKWKTMPEQMLMYRAAAFWTRSFAPEISLGMHTTEEMMDISSGVEVELPQALKPGNASALEAELMGTPKAVLIERDPMTGEVVPPADHE